MDRSGAIQDRFGAAAAAYTASETHRSGADLDAMLAAGLARDPARLLDLGCGPGHTALAFAARIPAVVALDLTPAMLDQARCLAAERGLANLCFAQANAARLPFASACFDAVTSRFSAHHVAEPAAMLGEVTRVLAPGGVFLLSDTVACEDPARDSFLNAFELLRDASHVRDHRISEWEAMFRAAGLLPELLGRFELPQDFGAWVARIATPPDAVTGLRALFDAAPEEVRQHFGIGADYAFRLEAALLLGRRPA